MLPLRPCIFRRSPVAGKCAIARDLVEPATPACPDAGVRFGTLGISPTQDGRISAVLSVIHEQKAGWHTFTSDQLPGLFVTGPAEHYEELRQSIAPTIYALLKAGSERGNERLKIVQVNTYVGEASKDPIWHRLLMHFAVEDTANSRAPVQQMSRLADIISDIMRNGGLGVP